MRGKLALAGLDLNTDLAVWLDAVYAIWVEAPFDRLDKLMDGMVKQVAILDPDEARKTWGQRPEHRIIAGNIGRGAEVGGPAAGHDPLSAMRRWEQARGVTAGPRRLRDAGR